MQFYINLLQKINNQINNLHPHNPNTLRMIGSIKNFISSKITPSEKDFQSRGVLTPQQFIQAGDQLQNFGWKWQKSLNKLNKHLSDPNKQYLMTQATSLYRIEKLAKQAINQSQNQDEYGFIEVTGDAQIQADEQSFRTYKVYITYDEYYHTPRLWIKGNSLMGLPLTSKQIFEDIYQEYHNETVTEETMPYLDCRMLTIHPCKHSDVLKRFIDQSKAKGKTLKPYQSLIVFLKFMSSIMPTIRYDQTIDVDL